MSKRTEGNRQAIQGHLPSVEKIQPELGKAESIDDFFEKGCIFSRWFAETLETMLEAEISEQLGYERYEVKGRNSGNSRNGKRDKSLRTSGGETQIRVPRDRKGEFQSNYFNWGRSGATSTPLPCAVGGTTGTSWPLCLLIPARSAGSSTPPIRSNYHRQLRQIIKTKGSFPTTEAARKLLYLVNDNVTKKWSAPVREWAKILNQLVIRFEGRLPIP